MRASGLVSIGPNLEKSWAGISGMPVPPAGAGPAGAGRAREEGLDVVLGDAALLAGALELGEIDVELAREPAHARAGVDIARIGVARRGPRACAADARRRRRLRGRRRLLLRDDRGRRGVTAASPPAQQQIAVPSLTLSPTLTSSFLHRAVRGAGTSMVALSLSSVIRGSSALTGRPA